MPLSDFYTAYHPAAVCYWLTVLFVCLSEIGFMLAWLASDNKMLSLLRSHHSALFQLTRFSSFQAIRTFC